MFKIGDKVINRYSDNLGQWEVDKIKLDGTIILKNGIDYLGIYDFSTIAKNWKLDKDYYRKLKLKKIVNNIYIKQV